MIISENDIAPGKREREREARVYGIYIHTYSGSLNVRNTSQYYETLTMNYWVYECKQAVCTCMYVLSSRATLRSPETTWFMEARFNTGPTLCVHFSSRRLLYSSRDVEEDARSSFFGVFKLKRNILYIRLMLWKVSYIYKYICARASFDYREHYFSGQ